MLDIVRITYSTISYVTEENSRVVLALKQCLPESLRNLKINKVASQSQFGDPLVYYSVEIEDEQSITEILSYFSERIEERNRDYLTRNFEKKIDLDERNVYIRFDKFKAYQEIVEVTEGGDVVRVVISYAAYTQQQNSITEISKTFRSYQIIGE